MTYLDMPPFWLLGALIVAWLQSRFVPVLAWSDGGWAEPVGTVLILLGVLLMAASIWEFARAKTTPIPRRNPNALITSGIFRLTRNPIYLGDALVLLGFILRWEATLSLILVPAFLVLIERRFILGEEERLSRAFGAEFEAYKGRVRRWI